MDMELIETKISNGYLVQFKLLMKLCLPIIANQIFEVMLTPMAIFFIGNFGNKIELAGVALAVSIINVTCVAVAIGFGTAVDTFMSQAYGANMKFKLGIILQRSIILALMISSMIIIFHIHSEKILILMCQDPKIAKISGDFIILFIPAEICYFLYTCLTKYLQNQNYVIPNVITMFLTNILNIILHITFLQFTNLGTQGSALALTCSYLFALLCLIYYIIMSKMYKNSWKGFTRESFVYWKSFIKLIIPGILMIALEFFIFEIGVITAGIIGPTELDTQSIIVQFNAIWYQLPVGVEISTAILIGQHVGSGDKKSSINLIKTSFVFISIISLVAGIALVPLRHSLSGIFTNDARVMMLIGEILPIISFYIFFDGINTVCKGILYGTGRQYIAVVLMFVIYYFIGLPISLIVMFKTHFGINGFWFALGCIIILISIFMTNSVIKTNWNDMIAQAAYRNNLSIHYDYTYENEVHYESMLETYSSISDLSQKTIIKRHYKIKLVVTAIIILMLSTSIFTKIFI